MADRRNSESDREAMLRRVAIVLSSLPAPVAAQLLGSIDPQTETGRSPNDDVACRCRSPGAAACPEGIQGFGRKTTRSPSS